MEYDTVKTEMEGNSVKKQFLSMLFGLSLCMMLLPGEAAARDIILIAPRPNSTVAFEDVADDAWYREAAVHVCQKKWMDPVEEGKFAPEQSATRGEVVLALWRLEGQPISGQGKSGTFADVPENEAYTEAVEWAASEGLIQGHGDGTFGPGQPVTREQLATILYRYEQKRGGGFTGMWMFRLAIADVAEISDWSYEPMCWMTMHKAMVGKGEERLDPKGVATRAEMAQILKNYLG